VNAATSEGRYAWLRRAPGGAPLVVAHRGASKRAPENTLAAFRLAISQGAPAVECDVQLSADGVPVVIHDGSVDRTTDGQGAVCALSLEDLRRLDAGRKHHPRFAGERIPTLGETLAACAGRARLFMELKPPPAGAGSAWQAPALVEGALAAVARAPAVDLTVISFDPEVVRLVARRRPDLPLGYLVGARHIAAHGAAAVLAATPALGAGFVSPQAGAASARFVAAAHAAGLPVSVWTVDHPEELRAVAAAGADAVTTNRPDVALALDLSAP
jgi:glycerophosphoryl diester phosphodiesterase